MYKNTPNTSTATTTSNTSKRPYSKEGQALDLGSYCRMVVRSCGVSGSPILCFMSQLQLVTLYFRNPSEEKAFIVPLQRITTPFKGVVPDLRSLNLTPKISSYQTSEKVQRELYGNAVSLLLETYSLISSCKPYKSSDKMSLFENDDGTLPPLSFRDYIDRLLRYTTLSKEVFVAAVVLLDRFLAVSNGAVAFRESSMHRLFFTGFVLAAKLLEDDCYNTTFFAKLGGVTKAELCTLEECFLNTLHFALGISEDIFAWYSSIVTNMACWIEHGHCKVRTWNKFISQLSGVARAASGVVTGLAVTSSEASPR